MTKKCKSTHTDEKASVEDSAIVADIDTGMKELAEIANSMEKEIGLEKSLLYFERGMKIAKECQDILKKAELRVKILVDGNKLEDFSQQE